MITRDMPSPQRFREFVLARECARLEKELLGGDGPHSDDPIIAHNRFCNVDREDDAVTRWVRTHVREKYQEYTQQFLVTQVLAARIWNHPPTLRAILPVPLDPDGQRETVKMLLTLRKEGHKTMRGAYMMPVHGNNGKGRTVDEYYMAAVSEASQVDWAPMQSLAEVAARLVQLLGIGEFLANQVCTDLRYTTPWRAAPDAGTFVLCGPGSRRGLDRYIDMNGPKVGCGPQDMYVKRTLQIRDELRAEGFGLASVFDDPNNLSNCFCEWDKYERVLQGEAARLHKYP